LKSKHGAILRKKQSICKDRVSYGVQKT